MPNPNSVIWLSGPLQIENLIKELSHHGKSTVEDAQKWFGIINQQPAQKASERIWEGINKIVSNA